MAPHRKIVFPLDVDTEAEAWDWTAKLEGEVGLMKVGLELFTSFGPTAVNHARSFGHEVMLDLKLHDIPATVGKAAMNAARLGAKLITVHASGGRKMVQAAVEAVKQVNPQATILAVTVLTSLEGKELADVLGMADAGFLVEKLATVAYEAGARGFVCSPLEVARLRKLFGPEAVLVVPGVRPIGAADNDQKRVATPAQAMKDGADLLVVGRPIRHASDPVAAARAIAEEIRPFC
jgi:orotidine-5'-phosphate decarboxylase